MPNTTSYECAHCGQIYDPGYAHVCHASRLIAEAKAALIALIEQRFGDGHDKPLIQAGVQDWQDFKQSVLEVKE